MRSSGCCKDDITTRIERSCWCQCFFCYALAHEGCYTRATIKRSCADSRDDDDDDGGTTAATTTAVTSSAAAFVLIAAFCCPWPPTTAGQLFF